MIENQEASWLAENPSYLLHRERQDQIPRKTASEIEFSATADQNNKCRMPTFSSLITSPDLPDEIPYTPPKKCSKLQELMKAKQKDKMAWSMCVFVCERRRDGETERLSERETWVDSEAVVVHESICGSESRNGSCSPCLSRLSLPPLSPSAFNSSSQVGSRWLDNSNLQKRKVPSKNLAEDNWENCQRSKVRTFEAGREHPAL